MEYEQSFDVIVMAAGTPVAKQRQQQHGSARLCYY